jgi:hypothetical protein
LCEVAFYIGIKYNPNTITKEPIVPLINSIIKSRLGYDDCIHIFQKRGYIRIPEIIEAKSRVFDIDFPNIEMRKRKLIDII